MKIFYDHVAQFVSELVLSLEMHAGIIAGILGLTVAASVEHAANV